MNLKKDKTGQFVTKEEFQRLQEQIKTLTMNGSPKPPANPPHTLPKTSAAPPPLPRRDTDRPIRRETEMRSAAEPPQSVRNVKHSCNKAGCDNGCSHRYEEIVLTPTGEEVDDKHTYELLSSEAGNEANILHRLTKVENNQQAIMKKQDALISEMAEIKALLEEIKRTSQKTLDKSMENSDHLGQQILHVRRDIQTSIKR